MTTMTRAHSALLLSLGAVLALPRCSCEGADPIQRAAVEMQLTLVEIDPCSNAAVTRRVPDDYDAASLPKVTDLGSRADRIFEVRSTGSAPLKITEVSLSQADPEYTLELADSAGQAITLPIDLAPVPADGSSPPGLVIRVAYQATDTEPDLVSLVVKTTDPKRNEVQFGLAAGRGKLEVCGTNGCGPDVAVQFGQVSRGSSATQELVLKNAGEGALDLKDLKLESGSTEFCAPEATSLPSGVTDCAPINLCRVLTPGEEYTIHVRYSPIDGGTDQGVLRIVSGDANRGTVEVPIQGTGAGPGLCAYVQNGTDWQATASIDFGAVAVGGNARRVVRLVSCGTEAAQLAEAALETSATNPFRTGPEFQLSPAFSPGTLSPAPMGGPPSAWPAGTFAEGEITYSPTTVGEHRGGLRFTMAPDAKSWIALAGRAATCDLEVLPHQVDFGTVATGASTDRVVVMANNGARDCSVRAITDPTNGFTIVNKPALPATIAAGQSVNLTVRYTAPARGTTTGDTSSFDVTSDEPGTGATNTVRLSAQGGGTPLCSVDVQPARNGAIPVRDGQLNFGATNIGYSKMLPIRVTNIGNTECVLERYEVTSGAASQFAVLPSAPLPARIQPGAQATLEVTFTPTGPAPLGFYGPLTNHIDLTLSGTGLDKTSWSIGISARPTVPTIDVIPESIDFGLVTWDRPRPPDNRSSCGSETRNVRIYNSGTGNLDISAIEIDATSDPVFLIAGVRNGGTPVTAPYQMSLAPGASAEVDLRFYPTRLNPASHSGLLVIRNNVTTESTVPLKGEGTANAQQTDVFSQLQDNKVDILWVVDDSGSMEDEQTSLGNNFGSFIGYADSLGVDYQVGVTTTEINDTSAGKLWACNGFNKIIRSSDTNRVQAFQCAASVTSPPNGNTRPNPGGSDEAEAGLQAARLALDAPLRDGDNAGFLRPDARLAAIIVSDEEDQSQGAVSLYVDFFRNIKGFRNPQLTTVSTIVGDIPNGCATADPGERYVDAARQLGGQFQSICSASWANMLQNLGLGVFALREAWTLSRPAEAASISVRVNGTSVPQNGANGWTYDAASNSIQFNGSAVPPPGARIEIQYGAVCIP